MIEEERPLHGNQKTTYNHTSKDANKLSKTLQLF